MILPIYTYGNAVLRKEAEEIKSDYPNIKKLIEDMYETMHHADGVGLAAPQIGKNIRLIVVRHKDVDLVIINPKISRKSLAKEWDEEGCLSVPGKYGQVKRHKKIYVNYLDQNGDKKKIIAEGFLARIIQHENDHLNGILFIDRAQNLVEINNEQN